MWLDAFSDTSATLYSFPSCVATADLSGDGDFRLIVGDIGTGQIPSKLKIYKGTGLHSEVTLQAMPTAVAPIFIDHDFPRTPVITVASLDYVYVYKNLRPFFRAVLPPLDINPMERDIWSQYGSVEALADALRNLQSSIGMSALSLKSQNFLSIPEHERDSFLESYKTTPLQRKNIVTCISTLKKSHNEEDALSCLVIGTENSEILVLHPETFTPIDEAKLSLTDVPVFLSTAGIFDIDYTLTCTTRQGLLLIGRRGYVSPLLTLSQPPVGVVCLDTLIIVALMDSTLCCYSDKGHKIWSTKIPHGITCIQRIHLRQKNQELIATGLDNGSINVYTISGECVDEIQLKEPISAMYFGQYGRESNSLIVVTQGGSLHVKLLKRNANFDPQPNRQKSNTVAKFQIPKKTKLFVDQTMRERENSIAMHRSFQRDAFRMKLETARALVHVLNTKQTPVVDTIKLSAEVLGLGPVFSVRVGIQNIGSKAETETGAIPDLILFFHWDDKYYDVKPPLIHVPLLVPGVEMKFSTRVESVNSNGLPDNVRIVVFRKKQTTPILVAMINMPPSDVNVT